MSDGVFGGIRVDTCHGVRSSRLCRRTPLLGGGLADQQLRRLEEILWARREPFFNPTPAEPLGPAHAAQLLASCLHLGADQFLVSAQLSYFELARHDGAIGGHVSSHQSRLRENCARILREAGVPTSAIEQEAVDLWALLIGLMALVPGLALDDPDDPEAPPTRTGGLTPDQVAAILRRHLEAAVARHDGSGSGVLDEAG